MRDRAARNKYARDWKTWSKAPSASREYRSWIGAILRCTDPSDKRYPHYGGRGIKVCERWQKFENFLADMGTRTAGLSLDRINNDGDYEPGNCRWADAKTQMRNQSFTKLTIEKANEIRVRRARGEDAKVLASEYGIDKSSIYQIALGRLWAP